MVSVTAALRLTTHSPSTPSLYTGGNKVSKYETKQGLLVIITMGPVVVSIATGYGLDGPGIESRWE